MVRENTAWKWFETRSVWDGGEGKWEYWRVDRESKLGTLLTANGVRKVVIGKPS